MLVGTEAAMAGRITLTLETARRETNAGMRSTGRIRRCAGVKAGGCPEGWG